MKYDEKYPVPKILELGPHQPFRPDKDQSNLYYQSGHYQCWICRAPTGWSRVIDNPDFPYQMSIQICSEECSEKFRQQQAEVVAAQCES